MNYHKKVQVGGDLGAELERIWAAIRSNQIKTSAGQRINRTPSGTTISFGTGNAEAEAATDLPAQKTAMLMEVNPFPMDAPEVNQPLGQLAVLAFVDSHLELVLLPPVNGNLPNTFEHDGRYFPSALYDGTNGGSSWRWDGGIGSLKRNMSLEVKKFGSGLAATSQSVIAPHSPSYNMSVIRYYIDDQSAGGWEQA